MDLFAREHVELLTRIADLRVAYNRTDRDDAEEAFGDYTDAQALASELLEEMRDHYARTLDDREEYVATFNRVVKRRYPLIAAELD
ncbi:MAG TPA: hypothetical protein VGH52_09445 [Gaiellaceae bacterium]